MTRSLRYLRLFLHLPSRERRAIGFLSAFGDVLRVSFDESYIGDPNRPTLSLSYVGATESDTVAILSSSRDARVVRNDGRWPTFFSNLLPERHNRTCLAHQRGCSEEDEFELLAAAGRDLAGAVEVEPAPIRDGRTPALSPLYDPVCVAAWFDELKPQKYALNRKVDRMMCALTFDDLRDLFVAAGIASASRLLSLAKATVKEAKSKWPAILRDAPDNLRASVERRLAGSVRLGG
jgi:HipA-like protein